MRQFLAALIVGSSVTLLTACINLTPNNSADAIAQQQQLQQQTWQVTKLNGQPIIANRTTPQLTFDSNTHRVFGTDGCNRIFGHYQIQGHQIQISPLASTRMACIGNQQLSDQFHLAMRNVDHFRVERHRILQLLDRNNQVVVELHSYRHQDN